MITFTVVIPTYNSSSTISKCVMSVLEQTKLPHEIIIVDDCSTDDTIKVILDLIKQHKNGYLIRLIQKDTNSGPGLSRNIGIELSRGQFISFLDSDDHFVRDKIRFLHNFITLNGGCVELISDSVNVPKKHFLKRIKYIRSVLKNQVTTTSSVTIKKQATRCFPDRKYAEDSLLWFDIMLKSNNCYELGLNLTCSDQKRDFSTGLSSNLYKMFLGVVSNYYVLYKKGMIGFFCLFLSCIMALVKLIIRFFKFRLLK